MVQTTNQTQKLEQLHQLVNNEVNGPKFYEFLNKSIPTNYDSNFDVPNGGWSPYINLCEYLWSNKGNNVLGLSSDVEINFFIYCIFNDDFEAFLNEFNGSYFGESDGGYVSTESDWERYTQNILNIVNR
jgi:hypothetical protein